MGFTLRLAEHNDLKWCASIIRDGFETDRALKVALSRLWADLIDAYAMTMVVVEDDLRKCPVAFGASVFVDDIFFDDSQYGRTPYLAVRLLASEKAGSPVSILRPGKLRDLNCPAKGLNLMVLHYVENTDGLTHDLARPVRDKAVGALIETQSGYFIKRVVFEFFGERDVKYAERMGVLIRTDYNEYFGKAGIVPPSEERPYLGELTRQEAAQNWGCPISGLFSYAKPLIFFSPMQQSVLLWASRGRTDELIARELDLSPLTVRAHWKAIFNRIIDLQRNGSFSREILAEAGITGQRQSLIRYLEQHPEELRPSNRRCFDT